MSSNIFPFIVFYFVSIYLNVQADPADCETYRSVLRSYGLLKAERSKNCCNLVGCMTNERHSLYEHWPVAPWCLEKIKPEFYLYTPENVNSNQTIDVFRLNDTVNDIKINKSKQLYAIIHGWNTKWILTNWMFAMKDALVAKGNNVILVRWSEGSNVNDYFQGAVNTLPVGKALSFVISSMVEQGKADLNSTTIVGFSLGGHAAGFAGANLIGLKRIIGLDPAGPMFACEDPDVRLSPNDAKFVQVLHTNGEDFRKFGRGTMEQLGNVDFYANSGVIQPGCEAGVEQTKEDLARFSFSNVWSNTSCSHARAPILFTEMVKRVNQASNMCSFTSYPCDNYESWKNGKCFKCPDNGCPVPGPLMDYGTPYKGQFYFGTQSDSAAEFCGRQYLVTLTSDANVKGQIYLSFRGSDGARTNSSSYFQGEESSITVNQPKTRVLVAPWSMDKIAQILITYTKFSGVIRADGVKQFKLTNVTLTSTDGKSFSSCSPVTVNSGEPTSIDFSSCQR